MLRQANTSVKYNIKYIVYINTGIYIIKTCQLWRKDPYLMENCRKKNIYFIDKGISSGKAMYGKPLTNCFSPLKNLMNLFTTTGVSCHSGNSSLLTLYADQLLVILLLFANGNGESTPL